MKTKHIYGGLVMTAAALLCLAGCKKDEEGEKIMLGTQFEKAVSAQKTYLGENNTVCWSAGDEVNVNGNSYTVSAEGVAVAENENGYAAVYPATEGNTLTYNGDVCGKNCTGGKVTIPAVQTYTNDGNGQVLNGPMAARLDSKSGTLYFRNLYSLLKVTVAADDKAFTVNSITVTATGDNARALAGTQSFKFKGATNTVENLELKDLTNSSTTVTLNCGSTTVNANNDMDFYIVAHPMTSQNLTVKVEGVLDGKMVVYTYHTASARSLNRSRIGGLGINLQQLEPVITGRFTVNSEGKQVEFAPGNLQYLACNSTAGDLKHQTVEGEANGMFRFAEHQYDYIGNNPGNSSTRNESLSTWIDLFGWGTSGYNEKYPYMTSQTNTDYGDGNKDIAKTYYDWGVYNEIQSFDGNTIYPKGTWRTPTNAEWRYLLGTGTGTRGANDWWIYNMVTIEKADGTNNVMGLIIYPDGVTEADLSGFTGKANFSQNSQTAAEITKTEFETLEAMGCVFLPAAGYRQISVSSAGSAGCYWSSTYNYNESSEAHYLDFLNKNKFEYVQPSSSLDRYYGVSVRLVKDVE